ncbi:MAG: hypothetical protein CML61_01480 [Rhodobacteraceae bacterium]|jgi:predicted small secreted protein|nr:hypothetical protein [Paracoccaceae bacterium]|tara:strand:+ start:58 stop:564 length:507 start_codon:yes stop_codon:yes gene_type:complete
MRRLALLLLGPLVLAACSNTGLRDIRSTGTGPDEFMISPVKPLQVPDSFTALPVPTPGQANLTDRSALQEGIVAFGGTPEAAGGPVPAADGALVRYAGRMGVAPAIRQTLAAADADFRRRKARFTQFRIVPVDRYNEAYSAQALDADRALARWRRAGARTPSAPPAAQ